MGTRKNKRIIARAMLLAVLFLAGLCVKEGVRYYRMIAQPNVTLAEETYLYIPTHTSYEQLLDILRQGGFIQDMKGFDWVARKKNLPNHVNPGRYLITNGSSNQELANLIRSGAQTPVNVTFNLCRTKAELAGKVAVQIEADSVSLLAKLDDQTFLSQFDQEAKHALLLCIPNTYEMYWNTSAEGFIRRMHQEYLRFWNAERRARADMMGMTVQEVGILASICQQEARHNDELPRISGVYINRLKIGMKLQADPTVKYALGDFTIQRLLNVDKQIDSPYNTYLYTGLPPSPICMPNTKSLNSVLYYEQHNYLYFCAREDFSGYHNFTNSYTQHINNARKYRSALTKNNIMR